MDTQMTETAMRDMVYIAKVYNGVEGPLKYCGVYGQTPIAVDMDGSGAIERSGAPTSFDLNADGTTELLDNWFASQDGILVDLAAQGPLDGRALFGDEGARFADGYAKLATRDADHDGQVAGDELSGLGLWHDNGNGTIDAGETVTAQEAGLTTLSTSHNSYLSTATVNGNSVVTEDVWFNTIG
jgi:hypothetical protein